MLIMAIDPNTRTGVTEGEPGSIPLIRTHIFRSDPTDDVSDLFERCTFWIADRLRSNLPDIVAIEAPVPPSGVQGATNFQTTLITVGMYAIITGVVRCKAIPIRPVHSSTWRKSFLGNGRLKTDVAKREAVKLCGRLGWDADDHNGAESAGIWHWCCTQVAPYGITTLHPALFAERAS